MKRLIIISLCIVSSHLLYSQAVIPKFGITKTTVDFSDEISQGKKINEKIGFVVGLGVELPVNKFLAIQPELLFHEKGWIQKYNDIDRKETYRLNYLEVPVLLKIKFGAFYITAGPYGAVGIRGKFRYSEVYQGQKSAGSKEIRFEKNVNGKTDKVYFDNPFDAGVQAGLGVKLFNTLYVDLRYGQSFVNIYKGQTGFQDNLSRNKGFQLTFGFPSPKD